MPVFYEDLLVGQTFSSPGRTVTETDLMQFAMLSGDWNPIHTDREFAARTLYGKPVVHGVFGIALLTGLIDRTGLFNGSAIAMLGIRDWQFKAPIFVGDTLHFVMEIVSKRLSSKGDRGIIDRHFQLINQREEVVQEGNIALMIRLAGQKEMSV
ncbi:MAG: MaoC family dehydratase N-terminal domain-containing protein [Ktedonobacteraceae bacterium]|nr:MaoC family dehydratase N-terminal domain-containing protein [Ktedonobacteraceae bacterium]